MPELQPSLEPVAGLGVPGLDNGYLAQMNEHPGGPAISASQAGPLVDRAWPSLLGTNATGRHPEAQSPMAYPLLRSPAGAGRTHVDNILASLSHPRSPSAPGVVQVPAPPSAPVVVQLPAPPRAARGAAARAAPSGARSPAARRALPSAPTPSSQSCHRAPSGGRSRGCGRCSCGSPSSPTRRPVGQPPRWPDGQPPRHPSGAHSCRQPFCPTRGPRCSRPHASFRGSCRRSSCVGGSRSRTGSRTRCWTGCWAGCSRRTSRTRWCRHL